MIRKASRRRGGINSPLEFPIKRETNPGGSAHKGERKVRNGRTNLWNDHWTECERETVVRPVYEHG